MSMASQRRRNRLAPMVLSKSVIFATTLILILFLACLFLFTFHLDADRKSFADFYRFDDQLKNSTSEVRLEVDSPAIFHVPNDGEKAEYDLWSSNLSQFYYGCCNASSRFAAAEAVTRPNRYLMIATSGGLNQQRTGITDAVVAARILNATLVVPKLDQKSFWKDSSDFAEIFDVDWFIYSLANDVKIIKQLPKRGGMIIKGPYTMRVPRKCNPKCYQTRVLPVMLRKQVVQLTKFDYRLSNRLETNLQKLRCRVNYHALRFTDPIQNMGDMLISKMREKSKHFIALHLRFEPDMLAFSGCYFGGGDEERTALGAIRRRWKTLHKNNPEKERRQGRCPLTPEEVGLMLRALGFGRDTHLYVASGEVYGGERTLRPLKSLFPNIHSKESLLSRSELSPFSPFSSRMAALDFIVCDGSDAFVTNNNGNMARILAGRRRYFGHRRTIRPNAKKLHSLFLYRENMTWDAFSSTLRRLQRGFIGDPDEVKPGRGEFHENPAACICRRNHGAADAISAISANRSQDSAEDDLPESEEEDEELDWEEMVSD